MKTAAALLLLALAGCTTASRQAGTTTVNISNSHNVRVITSGNEAAQDAAKAVQATAKLR